ncbi:MAG: ATP-binding protein [Bradymonadaceae bacterium]
MTPGRPEFVSRVRELNELRDLGDSPGAHMALLYGRRRVGKTYLLDYAWRDARRFYFLAADTTADRNRLDLLREFEAGLGAKIHSDDYPSWRTVFRLLASYAENELLIVILDEFQYLMGGDEGIVSQLNAVWDREVKDRDLTLVLCGSEVSTMASLQAGDSPLYGRINWRQRLRPLDYLDAAQMFPGRDERELASLYAIFGGLPQYLAAVGVDEPIGEAVARTFLSPRGEVHLQLENLIEQEKGIRDTAIYRAVLDAVARGNTETNDIAQAAGLQQSPTKARRALETLEELELIRRERNFAASRRAPWRNRIADHATRFWYRFVHPNRSRLETGDALKVWQADILPLLDMYMGKAFEDLCAQAFRRQHASWGLPDCVQWARWEGLDKNRHPIELDLVAELSDGKLLTGEFKWSSSPIDVDVHFELIGNLKALGMSGQGWARDALDPEQSHGFLYISAAGFTDAFRNRAEENQRIFLFDLSDLYTLDRGQ